MNPEQIKHLKSDDRLQLKALYNMYRSAFLNFGKNYGLDESLLADIYQEAFLAIRKHAISGKLDQVKSSFKTYLFGIGKYMIFDLLKKEEKNVSIENHMHLIHDSIEEIQVDLNNELTQEQKLLRTFFKQLGKKCQFVLTLFYYRGLTIEEIVESTDYENANTVKAQKSRCLKSLKQLINR
ncbi:sigma-70 family RNA polymerase sigma factor [Flavobacteriaceae bacterium R38]|nr:sigma-70 family RNA polymerase sigma factor [Flavobacteriaceae bacterium R38]